MFFDPMYIVLALPGLLVGLWAQAKLTMAYEKYKQVGLVAGVTGAEAAREVLDRAGLVNVPVEEVPGKLTDHYDPTKRALFLSQENYHSRSVAAVGVAAHEAGHALQHQVGYAPLNLRMSLVPITRFASVAYIGILALGFILGGAMFAKCIWAVVGIFALITFFQLVTLPVEFDASRRAKEQLMSMGLVRADEAEGVRKVLSAAALTYVAALVSSVMQMLYMLTLARHSRN
jgi:Zn-dependent membrane protease YugP